MKFIKISLAFIIFMVYNGTVFSHETEKALVDIKFSIDTRMGLTKGQFRKSELKIKDRKKMLGLVEIDVSSIDTDSVKRDNHLRNEDFFDVTKYSKAVFEIIEVQPSGKDSFLGKGNLTIKNIKKTYSFPIKLERENKSEKFTGKIKINRKDFGIDYSSSINPIQDIADVEFIITIPAK
ncbi:MAG: YceI family protein [Leptospiraceae bacterium]|nr:YceI family protein [Leptospiraceae bacterium]MCK6381537.1 YceI family protein [Leptospiraceae bacterium]NUM41059.1 YceI family protein [Leptospiraceae bacterium]